MITLYKYLRESIFDDEEEILDNTLATALLIELTHKIFPSIVRRANIEDVCKIENKTLYIDAYASRGGCVNFNQDSLRAFTGTS